MNLDRNNRVTVVSNLEPGTYFIRFLIYRYESKVAKGDEFASAELDVSELVPGMC